jgi:1,2-diacylglycerol 3-alpha-glucosyltransferase
MARKRGSSVAGTVSYILSAVIALSLILGLLGPVLMRPFVSPTPTWPPTWTPRPTATETPLPPTPRPFRTPAVEPEEPLAFAVCGNSRRGGDVYMRLLDKIVRDGNDFVVHVGDLVERGDRQHFAAFQALMADYPLPFYPIPGEHDLGVDGSVEHFLAYSGAPAPHYSFDVASVHLTMANSAPGRLSQEELDWIDQDLEATRQPVKIVCVHHPPFDLDGTGYVLESGNDAFMALMQKHGVAYVFASHIHAYSQAEREGTVYVATGGAGALLDAGDHANAFTHYVQVTVDDEQVRTEAVRLE